MNLELHDNSAFPEHTQEVSENEVLSLYGPHGPLEQFHWSAEVGKFSMKSIFKNWFLKSLVLISDAGTGTAYDRPSLVYTVHMTQIGSIIGTKLFRENCGFISFEIEQTFSNFQV